jgi:hypothetical protein
MKLDFSKAVTLLANVAVLGGLVFLGYETRQNTIQLRAQASNSITEGLSRGNAAIFGDPVLADLVRRGEQDLSLLTPTEMAQFGAYEFDRINLAIQVMTLEADGLADVQFPYVDFLVQEFHTKPGLQAFIVAVEDNWMGAPELYEMLRLD